jgi:hypothetical protein
MRSCDVLVSSAEMSPASLVHKRLPNTRWLLPNAIAVVGVRYANASIRSVCSRSAGR